MSLSLEYLTSSLSSNLSILGRLLGHDKLMGLHSNWIRNLVLKNENYILLAHRGSYKSTCIALGLVLSLILLPNRTIAVCRKTEDDAKMVVGQVRSFIQDERVKRVSTIIRGEPIKVVKGQSMNITTNYKTMMTKEASLTSECIRGSHTGRHYDKMIFDDIVTFKDRYSKVERDYTKAVFNELRYNVLNHNGSYSYVGTPWHPDDATSLLDVNEVVSVNDSGIIPAQRLEQIKADMAPSHFSINYMLEHSKVDFYLGDVNTMHLEDTYFTIAHLDKSFGGKDFTALTLVGQRDGEIYVRGFLFNDITHNIQSIVSKSLGLTIHTEKNDDKGMSVTIFPSTTLFSLYHESMKKEHKIETYISRVRGRLTFCSKGDPNYLAQVQDWRMGASVKDDAPDSLASAIRILLHGSDQVAVVHDDHTSYKEYSYDEDYDDNGTGGYGYSGQSTLF